MTFKNAFYSFNKQVRNGALKKAKGLLFLLLAFGGLSFNSFAQNCGLAAKVLPSSVFYSSPDKSDGAFMINVVGGKAPFKVTVYDMHMNLVQPTVTESSATFGVMDLPGNYYWIDIVDANGCKTFVDFDLITKPCTFNASYSECSVKVPAAGKSDGAFTVSILDGTGPFTVTVYDLHMNAVYPLLSFPSKTFTISGLKADYYWVGIADSKGCWGFVDVDVQTPRATFVCSHKQDFWGDDKGKCQHKDGKWYSSKEDVDDCLKKSHGRLVIGCNGHSITICDSKSIGDYMPASYPDWGYGNSSVCKPLEAGNCLLGSTQYKSKYGNKKINNSLLSQTITLGLNLKHSPGLGCVSLEKILSCYWILKGLPNKTVSDLYLLANDALGGKPLPAYVSLNMIADFVKRVNEYYANCRSYNNKPCMDDDDDNGHWRSVSAPSVTVTESDETTVKDLAVTASPNPFHSNVHFVLQSKLAGQAELVLYNMVGAKVAVPYSGYLSAGHSQAVDYKVPSTVNGGLIYVLKVGSKTVSGKLLSDK